jgi:hypothetical protein
MNWDQKAFDIEIKKNIYDWVCLVDNKTNHSKGIACIQKTNTSFSWEVHWAGVQNDDIELYTDLYENVFAYVIQKTKKENANSNKSDVFLTSYFTTQVYNNKNINETDWADGLINYLNKNHLKCLISKISRDWGTQLKLTVSNHDTNFIAKDKYRLMPVNDYQKEKEENVKAVLNMGMTSLFAQAAMAEAGLLFGPSAETIAQNIKQAFIDDPNSFYIYEVAGKAVGFIQYHQKEDAAVIDRCVLLKSEERYADHFISTMSEDFSNFEVLRFKALSKMPECLKKAVMTCFDKLNEST